MVSTCADILRADQQKLLKVITPALDYTVTHFDPSWFDTENPENAPTLFYLTLDNTLDSLSGRVRLRMLIAADTSLGRNAGAPLVMGLDRLSAPLTSDKFGITHRSNEVFQFAWVAGSRPFSESDMFDLIIDKRQTPEMNIIFSFALTCDDDIAASTQFIVRVDSLGGSIGRLRHINTVQALYPGTQISNSRPVPIYTITPIFNIVSEIFNSKEFQYPAGEPKIEIFLYELLPGETPSDALQGMEFARIPMFDKSPVAYPPNLPRLNPGKTYVWRARVNLRGPTADFLYSNALYFMVDQRLEGGSSPVATSEISDVQTIEQQVKYGEDYSKRVMAALKLILGENFEIFDQSRSGKVPSKGQIRLNGHPYSLEELERLAREFYQGRHSLTRVRFQ